MKVHSEEIIYQSPNVDIIEIKVEKGFANSPQLENPGFGGDM